jgi:hypothetical protein
MSTPRTNGSRGSESVPPPSWLSCRADPPVAVVDSFCSCRSAMLDKVVGKRSLAPVQLRAAILCGARGRYRPRARHRASPDQTHALPQRRGEARRAGVGTASSRSDRGRRSSQPRPRSGVTVASSAFAPRPGVMSVSSRAEAVLRIIQWAFMDISFASTGPRRGGEDGALRHHGPLMILAAWSAGRRRR